MTALALLAHSWRRHRVALVVLALGMFVFEWLITRLAPVASQAAAFQQLLNLLPPALMAMFGNEMAANLNPLGALAFGWVHPFAIVLPAAWAARVTAGALAGEVGGGTMDLIASRPVSRGAIVAAALITLALGLLIIDASGWLGTAVGVAQRPSLEIAARPFIRVAAMQWLVFMGFGSVGLTISARGRNGGTALGVTAAIIAVSFALDYVARAWKPIAWMHVLSLFDYYGPRQLVISGFPVPDLLTLALVAVAASGASFAIFARRDL